MDYMPVWCFSMWLLAFTFHQVMYPPVHQRGAWTQPLTVIPSDSNQPVTLTQDSLPHLRRVTQTTQATWANSPGGPAGQLPRPPSSIRSRPLSAGARQSGSETFRIGERTSVLQPAGNQRGELKIESV